MANYDASTVLKAAYAQATGSSDISALNVEDLIDRGADSSLFTIGREDFTKALIEQCAKIIFTDASYEEEYEDPFYTDSVRFGSWMEVLSIQAPEVKENPAWSAITSGTSTVGQYVIELPSIEAKCYGKTDSYAIDVTISNQRWDDALRSENDLTQLVDYIFTAINNALLQHKEDYSGLNRATLMSELLIADADVTDTGVHKIELRSAYNSARNKNIASRAAFMADADAMRWAAKQLTLYADFIKKQSALFNVGGKVKFCPSSRLVIELNTDFERSLEEVALSDTFRDSLARQGSYHTVPWWQGETISDGQLTIDATSKIHVKLDKDTTIEQDGIVALLADKMALMHTTRNQRVGSQYFDIEGLTLYSFQRRDSYMCNSSLPAIIFTIEDPSEP